MAVNIVGFQNLSMAQTKQRPRQRRRIFLKEWRKFRGLTQEQLAEKVGMVVSNISQLEQGRQGYSKEGLEALAGALNCEPGHLLSVDPTGPEAIWPIWDIADPAQRRIIVDISKTIVKRVP